MTHTPFSLAHTHTHPLTHALLSCESLRRVKKKTEDYIDDIQAKRDGYEYWKWHLGLKKLRAVCIFGQTKNLYDAAVLSPHTPVSRKQWTEIMFHKLENEIQSCENPYFSLLRPSCLYAPFVRNHFMHLTCQPTIFAIPRHVTCVDI